MGLSQTYFQFKQFLVRQERCAMKVTTDACIQGAWTTVPANAEYTLDIGTGTGLLSLMMTQKHPELLIDGIELDADAAEQAAQNVLWSPWGQQIHVHHADVRHFRFSRQYDLVITNPPFFNDSLLGGVQRKNDARHTLKLTYDDLLAVILTVLKPKGWLSILLPTPEFEIWERIAAEAGLHLFKVLHIRHTPTAIVKRKVGLFARARAVTMENVSLTIKEADGSYTGEFTDLLRPFYLHF